MNESSPSVKIEEKIVAKGQLFLVQSSDNPICNYAAHCYACRVHHKVGVFHWQDAMSAAPLRRSAQNRAFSHEQIAITANHKHLNPLRFEQAAWDIRVINIGTFSVTGVIAFHSQLG